MVGAMNTDMRGRCKPEYRMHLAAVLRHEKSAREMFARLIVLGAKNMRHDYMLVRNAQGTYDRLPDLTAWYAECKGGLFVALIRHSDGMWSLHS